MQTVNKNLPPDKLKKFFVTHLNRIYCAKSYMIKRLPEIEGLIHYGDLKNAIKEITEKVKKQVAHMREIYVLLKAEISIESYKGFTGLVEDTFITAQKNEDPVLRDMSILFYLQNIGSLEMSSIQVLQLAAVKLRNKHIKQLLKENFEADKADRALLMLMTAKYITG